MPRLPPLQRMKPTHQKPPHPKPSPASRSKRSSSWPPSRTRASSPRRSSPPRRPRSWGSDLGYCPFAVACCSLAFGAPLHAGSDGGGGSVEDRDPVPLDDFPPDVLVRVIGGALEHHRGAAVGHRAVDDVGVPG